MESIEDLLKNLGLDPEAAYKAYHQLLQIVTRAGAPGNEDDRAMVATALAGHLGALLTTVAEARKAGGGKISPTREAYVCHRVLRLLSYVGGAKEVPAIVPALADDDVQEMARFALDRNGSEEATDALIAAFDQVGPTFRIGVIGALGERRGAKVLKVLQTAGASDADPSVRIAAVEALAKHSDASSDPIMEQMTKAECPQCRQRAHQARVRLAETLRAAGKRSEAAAIYRAVKSSGAEAPQKKAAEIGLKAVS